MSKLNATINDGVPEITCQELFENLKSVRIIDVRRPEEFNGELAHIKGAELHTLGPAFEEFIHSANKDQEIVFVCRSGGRSGQATLHCKQLGFRNVYNLQGGMLAWKHHDLPTTTES